jgi:hypothetical protein
MLYLNLLSKSDWAECPFPLPAAKFETNACIFTAILKQASIAALLNLISTYNNIFFIEEGLDY